jgi:hypothetical protein
VDRWRGGLPFGLEGGGLLAANVGSGAAAEATFMFTTRGLLFHGLGPSCCGREVGVELGVGG